MIVVSELRLGNLVTRVAFDGDRLTLPVVEINGNCFLKLKLKESVSSISCIQQEVEPVALTEEWLFKLGFQGMDEDGLYSHPDNELFQVQHEYLEEKFDHVWDTSFTGAPIEFVHQLQNLYYALTGEELTVKP